MGNDTNTTKFFPKRRHRRKKPNPKPLHNSPCTKYQAIMQYERVKRLPTSGRVPGDVERIAWSLPVPVSRKTLWSWHTDNDQKIKLKRKPGSGTQLSIMDEQPIYRNDSFLPLFICSVHMYDIIRSTEWCMTICRRTPDRLHD